MKARFFLLSDSSSMFESMCRLRAWWGSAAKTCMLLSNGILFSEDRRDKQIVEIVRMHILGKSWGGLKEELLCLLAKLI